MKLLEINKKYETCKISNVKSRGLPRDSTCVLKAEPGKHDIKRRKPVFFLSVNKLVHPSL